MEPGTQEWLDQVVETPLDTTREIIDPHHHLWPPDGALPYGVDALVADTGAGHNIVETVFIECHAAYRTGGADHLRPVGETEFVAAAADELAERFPDAAPISGIVAHADLAHDQLDDILDAHESAAGGRFRGIRDALARALEPDAHMIPGLYAEGKSADPAFRSGVARLGERGLTYDCWNFHHQITDFTDLARATPGTTMVLDHFGTPVGVGRFAGRHDQIFEQWKLDIAEVAACPNTVAKLGGLAMPDNGFGFHTAAAPPTSDELLRAQRRWYEHTIECFGPERCMFESNFPVDRFSLSYTAYWNAMQKLAAQYSDAEQDALFSGTARRVYRL
ncbi:amidohydrolase family protein [Ilumatobacter nonamiensis]|uniref:amidohydrolase family protein n=1 Tax=Ilumatobacter nonamiensis TaxID=467093 RepID=UPI00034C0086|nr:amidohydrolase family protein [Ilumatobacter nonamiensis]